ncbi:MAG: nitronate monooxygenase, partial [Deltaproteobacteria bacterium]|nr:nitronate monooxygenase [Deltaproteobacteria bacterium]
KAELKSAIKEVKTLTDKPFMVNVTILPSIGIHPDRFKDYFEAITEEGVPALEISGMPLNRFEDGKYFTLLKKMGVKIFQKVGSVRHGKSAQKAGYDGVIAAGVEEGGHPLNENVATTVLTPRMVEELEVPVITAGGMADGRGLAAALCLGADGILMGTRFINTLECKVHENIYEEFINRHENETVLYGNTFGLQGRALLNDSIREVLRLEAEGKGIEEILPHLSGSFGDDIWQKGKTGKGLIPVGQTIGLIHDVVSCRKLLDRMVKEAEDCLQQNLKKFRS